MPKKGLKTSTELLLQILFLFISIIALQVIDIIMHGTWIKYGTEIAILSINLISIICVAIKNWENKKHRLVFSLMIISEIIGLIFISLSPLLEWLSLCGLALLYITISISWIIILKYKGFWGNKKATKN